VPEILTSLLRRRDRVDRTLILGDAVGRTREIKISPSRPLGSSNLPSIAFRD